MFQKTFRYILWLCLLTLTATVGMAQNQRPGINRTYEPDAVEQGNFLINAGVGFFSVFAANERAGYSEEMPPIYICPEYAISDGMSAGLYVGYSSFKQNVSGQNAKLTAFLVGPRLSYRIFVNEKVDVYASLIFGIAGFNARNTDTNQRIPLEQSYIPYYGTMLGARYFFSNNLGANLEVGWGLTLVNLGLTYRIATPASSGK